MDVQNKTCPKYCKSTDTAVVPIFLLRRTTVRSKSLSTATSLLEKRNNTHETTITNSMLRVEQSVTAQFYIKFRQNIPHLTKLCRPLDDDGDVDTGADADPDGLE